MPGEEALNIPATVFWSKVAVEILDALAEWSYRMLMKSLRMMAARKSSFLLCTLVLN